MVNLNHWMDTKAKWNGAACAERPKLPWAGDDPPPGADRLTMTQICANCPIIVKCATYALTGTGIGGFYAGVWVPWPGGGYHSEVARRTARVTLKRIIRALTGQRRIIP